MRYVSSVYCFAAIGRRRHVHRTQKKKIRDILLAPFAVAMAMELFCLSRPGRKDRMVCIERWQRLSSSVVARAGGNDVPAACRRIRRPPKEENMSVQRPLNSKMSVRDLFVRRHYVTKKRLLDEIHSHLDLCCEGPLISWYLFSNPQCLVCRDDDAARAMVSFFQIRNRYNVQRPIPISS